MGLQVDTDQRIEDIELAQIRINPIGGVTSITTATGFYLSNGKSELTQSVGLQGLIAALSQARRRQIRINPIGGVTRSATSRTSAFPQRQIRINPIGGVTRLDGKLVGPVPPQIRINPIGGVTSVILEFCKHRDQTANPN